jgi:hypothetical protein
MIEEWAPETSYSAYFTQCAPRFCTYSRSRLIDLSSTLALFLSLYGGLTMILRLVAGFLATVAQKLKHGAGNVIRRTSKLLLFLYVKDFLICSACCDMDERGSSVDKAVELLSIRR